MDVGCKINEAVNGWFTSVVTDAINPAFVMVGQTLLSAPPPSMLARVQELTGHVQTVANALLVLFVLAGGVIVMSHGTLQTSTTVKEVLPGLVGATALVNSSLAMCEYAIEMANALVGALLGAGVDGRRAGNLIARKVLELLTDQETSLVFLVLLIGVAVVLGFILAFIAIIRVTLLMFLIITAPLALLCHGLPQTQGIARLWWRSFIGVLAIQVLQALVLILAFKTLLTDAEQAFPASGDTVLVAGQTAASRALDALILIGILFVLVKIPGWVARTVWQQAQPTLLKRAVKAVVVYKTLGALGSAFRKSRRAKTAGRTAAHHSTSAPAISRKKKGPPRASAKTPGRQVPSGGRPVKQAPAPQGPQQLALPFEVRPVSKPPATTPPPSAPAPRGRQLALPFPVTRVPRTSPPAAPAPPTGAWVRPRPPWVQDRLPGMPTRAPKPGQLRLRLDPPPRRQPRQPRNPGESSGR
ncbi:conjugal transfer protein TrbL family protein [Herbidospora cretacea]|uniref:conjugal transfer protein TrbL family protein n=1 Tax=Herbidospora cretacea TaxID=28444 RepID=UPI000773AD67|nr:conjugal transfer protein TrbL family protein [Herbidospora cretacea]